jgi:hypothetical protein
MVSPELRQAPAVDLGHVDVPMGVDADGTRHRELAGAGAQLAPVLKHLPVTVEDRHAAGAAVGDEETPVGGEEEAVRRTPLLPLGEELAVGVEHLDAVVLAVAHVNLAVLVDDDGVRQVELAFALALRAPLLDVAAVFREHHDPRVAVVVGDGELARGVTATSVGWLNRSGAASAIPCRPRVIRSVTLWLNFRTT